MAGGYIGPADGGFPVSNAETRYYFLGCRVPFAPPNWTVTGFHRGHITQGTQVTAHLPTSMKEYPMWGSGAGYEDTVGSVDGLWGDVTDSTTVINCGAQSTVSPDPLLDPPSDTGLQTTRGRMRNDLNANTSEIHAAHHLVTWIYDYDEATDTMSGVQTTRDIEVIGRESAWKPYAANRSASAWFAQWVISATLNKVAYESRQSWSVPL